MVYLCLFRGINVGGNNIIKMETLKSAFDALGFRDVRTYIQSGNVIFSSEEKDKAAVTGELTSGLEKNLGMDLDTLVFTGREIRTVVEGAPSGYGTAEAYKYDILFFKDGHNPKDVFKDIRVRDGVDILHQGEQVIYAARPKSLAGKSYLPKIVSQPFYKYISIRNWNTTRKLYELMEK